MRRRILAVICAGVLALTPMGGTAVMAAETAEEAVIAGDEAAAEETVLQGSGEASAVRSLGEGELMSLSFSEKPSLEELSGQLPATLPAQLSDGSTREVPVRWTSVEDYEGTELYFYTFLPQVQDAAVEPDQELPYVSVSLEAGAYAQEQGEEDLVGAVNTTANIRTIFNYATGEMGLNRAAAAGIIANIKAESAFNPNALGDSGTSYGICQWHNTRWTALKNYCNRNGYSWKSLEGQLHYLEYELRTSYRKVWNTLCSVPDNAQGAYTAAWNWCYYFEIPANRKVMANYRGNLAQGTYYPMVKSWAIPSAVDQFTDMASAPEWARTAVNWALAKGITSGTSSTTFSPNASCTRGQIVTCLYRLAGSPAVSSSTKFSDVPTSLYCAKAVSWALQKGITNGTTATTFSPDAPCTRAQAMQLIYAAAGSPKTTISTAFRDVPSTAYYAAAVSWAVKNGITSGTSSTTFSPDQTCTRAQIMTFLYRWKN